MNYNAYLTHAINLDICNSCLLKCPRCARQNVTDDRLFGDNISLERMNKLSKLFHYLNFCGTYSDPIYHPNFKEILKLCISNNNDIVIYTNGHGKTDKWWKDVINICGDYKNIGWGFALDGLPKDSHIYRVGQDGEAVWERMKQFNSNGINVIWQYIVFKYNEADMEAAKKLAKDNNINIDFKASNRWEDDDELKPLSPQHYSSNDAIEFYPQCVHGQQGLAFFNVYDGFFSPCCKIHHPNTLNEMGITDDSLHIDNIKCVDDIILSEQWSNFFNVLQHDASKIPKECLMKCSVKANKIKIRI